MDKTIEVQTSAGPVIVKKLAMEDYADLIRAFQKLPAELSRFMGENKEADLSKNETWLVALPPIIANAVPEFCAVLAVATDKDVDFHLKQLDLADNIEVFVAALELNDYKRVINLVKKIMAPSKSPTSQAAAEEPAAPKTEV